MSTPRLAVVRLLSWTLLSPWLFAVAVAFAVAMSAVHEVADVASRAANVGRRADRAHAIRLADAAAVAAMAAPERLRSREFAGVEVGVDGASFAVQVRLPNGTRHRFVGDVLPGAAPAAFGSACSVAEPDGDLAGAAVMRPEDRPMLDLPPVLRTDVLAPCLQRDTGIALLQLRAGTDADDFVFAARHDRVELAAAGGMIVVPGHLWVESGPKPLVAVVPNDLVVVVLGNLYLQRSIEVQGPGRLVLVAAPADGAVRFVDEDGNGRWSESDRLLDTGPFHGPIEGAGSAVCGSPTGAEVVSAASVVVTGQLHLRGPVRVRGPLVLLHGVTRTQAGASLHAAGEWCFAPERERVPAFVTTGEPRAGFLRRAGESDAPTAAVATLREQPLYLTTVAR